MPSLRRLVPVTTLALAAACSSETPKATTPKPIDRANLDTTCAACTDFYQFANGGWLKKATIPASYSSYGAFEELNDRNEEVLHQILDESAADAKSGKLAAGSGAWKVGTYYAACTDTVAIDQLGVTPLKFEFDVIASIQTTKDLALALSALERRIGIAPWADGSEQNPREATAEIAVLGQGGMSLPERDYYFKTDSATRRIRDQFVAHVTRMFVLMGDALGAAAAEARTVLEFETRLAGVAKTPIQLRDPVANYHKLTLAQVDALTPGFS